MTLPAHNPAAAKRYLPTLVAMIAVLFILSGHAAYGETLCVTNLVGLRQGLNTWRGSTQTAVVIHLVQGTYKVDSSKDETLGEFQANTTASLQLLGGYEVDPPGCSVRSLDPRNTVIDGNNDATSKLALTNVGASVLVEGVTLRQFSNGIDVVHTGSAPATGHVLKVRNSLVVENNTQGNAYTFRLWGSGSASSGAEVAFENSVLARNSNHGSSVSSALTTGNGGLIRLTNSTIAWNGTNFLTAGLQLQSYSVPNLQFEVSNNIAWHNGSANGYIDLDVSNASSPPQVEYSLIGAIAGAIQPTDTNLSSDPRFVSSSSGNFRLTTTSPAIDAGDNNQSNGIPDNDVQGLPRIVGTSIDLGAYEGGDTIFADSVELFLP